jgi:hypothetical protein
MPALPSSAAMTPPTAPAPTMTTSVFCVAMVSSQAISVVRPVFEALLPSPSSGREEWGTFLLARFAR